MLNPFDVEPARKVAGYSVAEVLMPSLAVITLCCLAAQSAVAQSPAGPALDEAAVRAVVARYVVAREKRDPALLEALFTADADQLVTTGEWRQGRANVVKGGLASSQANPGSRQIAIEAVRLVAPDVAIADGRYDVAAAQAAPARHMRTTFVMVRGAAGEWRIAAIRNMAPTDPAR
jgi:uncharacterized protein (TIGR02246 family)